MAAILLLDDDANFRNMAATVLVARGHDVAEAKRCSDADKLLLQRSFDAIVVDYLLPDSDGIAWVERFRAHDTETPVLLVTAFFRNDARMKALPVSGVLKKPVTPDALALRVERAMNLNPSGEVELSSEGRAQLAQVTAAFRRELPALVRGVIEAISQLRRNPSSGPVRGVAQRRAHQLAGTAGTFGFGRIGDACAQLDNLLQAMAKGAPADWVSIDRALSVIGEEQRREQQEPVQLSA